MITIKNTQRTIIINKKELEKTVNKILEIVGYKDFDIGVWITNNKTIRQYNKAYRNKDKATDVLSFPFWPELKPGQKIIPSSSDDQNLGDLILSAEYIKKAAEDLNVSFNDRMRLLLVHGVLHLLGYDHIKDADFRQMRAKEVAILKKLQK